MFSLGTYAGFEVKFHAVFDDDFQGANVYQIVHVHVNIAFIKGYLAWLGGEHFHDGTSSDDDFAAGKATINVVQNAHGAIFYTGNAVIGKLCDVFTRIEALVGGEIVAVMSITQKFHGFHGFLNVKEIWQLGVADVFSGQNGITHIAHIIRCYDGDMVRGVAGGVHDFKVCATKVDVVFAWHDELIGFYEHGGDVIVRRRLLGMEHIKIIRLQIERCSRNACFTGGKCYRNIVFLLKIRFVPTLFTLDVHEKILCTSELAKLSSTGIVSINASFTLSY